MKFLHSYRLIAKAPVGYKMETPVTNIGQPILSGMPISKAIEILKISTPSARSPTNADYHDAIKLGIEALKRIELDRKTRMNYPNLLLPGETED